MRPTGLIGQIGPMRPFPAAINPSTPQVFGVWPSQLFAHEQAIFTDELIIKIDFAAAVFGTLNRNEVPVDLTSVAVVGFLVRLAWRKMKGTGDLLVKKNVPHRLQNVRVEPERELTDVAAPLFLIKDSVYPLGFVANCLNHFPIFKS